MFLNRSNINHNGRLSHLLARDLFSDNIRQVFAAKTGKYLGVIKLGQQIDFEPEQEEEQEQPEPINKSQLSLF